MTNNFDDNQHFGFIRAIDNNEMEIGVDPPIACSSCEVSSSCGLSDLEEKLIQVKINSNEYDIGEKVQVTFEEKLSTIALLIVYIFPLLVIIVSIYIIQIYTDNELIVGLVALFSLVPYFLLFKLFDKKINKVFSFSIRKLSKEIQNE
jgi:sigma-E factor negative regulatory protein RseC